MICWECREKANECHQVRYISYIENKEKTRDVCGTCYKKLKFDPCHYVQISKIRQRSLKKK